jgi:diguanylate cyclase (GGDEF)-like protein
MAALVLFWALWGVPFLLHPYTIVTPQPVPEWAIGVSCAGLYVLFGGLSFPLKAGRASIPISLETILLVMQWEMLGPRWLVASIAVSSLFFAWREERTSPLSFTFRYTLGVVARTAPWFVVRALGLPTETLYWLLIPFTGIAVLLRTGIEAVSFGAVLPRTAGVTRKQILITHLTTLLGTLPMWALGMIIFDALLVSAWGYLTASVVFAATMALVFHISRLRTDRHQKINLLDALKHLGRSQDPSSITEAARVLSESDYAEIVLIHGTTITRHASWVHNSVTVRSTVDTLASPWRAALREQDAQRTVALDMWLEPDKLDSTHGSLLPIVLDSGELVGVLGVASPHHGRPYSTNEIAVLEELVTHCAIWMSADWLALHDSLTGLLNRRGFERHVTETTNCSILLLDLDKFKAVNDIHGHDAGDEVLRTQAQRITTAASTTDIVARLGGDEFIIWTTSPVELLYRLSTELSKPIDLFDTITVQCPASIGVATSPQHGTTLSQLMATADQAMYKAKTATSTSAAPTSTPSSDPSPQSKPEGYAETKAGARGRT